MSKTLGPLASSDRQEHPIASEIALARSGSMTPSWTAAFLAFFFVAFFRVVFFLAATDPSIVGCPGIA